MERHLPSGGATWSVSSRIAADFANIDMFTQVGRCSGMQIDSGEAASERRQQFSWMAATATGRFS
jgi:hypothetical protein